MKLFEFGVAAEIDRWEKLVRRRKKQELLERLQAAVAFFLFFLAGMITGILASLACRWF